MLDCVDACVLLYWWSSVDGEKYDGEQGQYFNEQDQQEHFEQGKYNMGLSLLPTHFIIIIIHVACV